MKLVAKIKGLENFFRQYPDKKDLFIVSVISMEQPSQTGEKFKAFVEQINIVHQKRGLKKLVIILTDFLQRHYVELNTNLKSSEVEKLANKKGVDWKRENRKFLTFSLDLNINFEIISWEKLLNQHDFKEALDRVKNLYKIDEKFKNIIDKLSNHYAEKLNCRFKSLENSSLPETFFKAAKNYLLEESAIWGPLLKLNFDFITYPGSKNEAVEYTYTKLFQSPGCILPWLRYSFEKKNSSFLPKKLNNRSKSLDRFTPNQFSSSFNSPKIIEDIKLKKFLQDRRYSV